MGIFGNMGRALIGQTGGQRKMQGAVSPMMGQMYGGSGGQQGPSMGGQPRMEQQQGPLMGGSWMDQIRQNGGATDVGGWGKQGIGPSQGIMMGQRMGGSKGRGRGGSNFGMMGRGIGQAMGQVGQKPQMQQGPSAEAPGMQPQQMDPQMQQNKMQQLMQMMGGFGRMRGGMNRGIAGGGFAQGLGPSFMQGNPRQAIMGYGQQPQQQPQGIQALYGTTQQEEPQY